jgi:hypothetical protein
VGGQAIDLGGEDLAAIDTGTALLVGPAAAVANIWAAVPNSAPLTGNMEGFFSFRAYSAYFLMVPSFTQKGLLDALWLSDT